LLVVGLKKRKEESRAKAFLGCRCRLPVGSFHWFQDEKSGQKNLPSVGRRGNSVRR